MNVIAIEYMSIRLEVNLSPKHQLICNYYHSNGFYLIYLCKQQAKQSFYSILVTFLVMFIFFFISENQSDSTSTAQGCQRHENA